MNFKSTALLFGLLLGMLWFFGLMLDYRRITQDENYVVPSLHDNPDVSIVLVKVVRQGKDKKPEEFVFTKEKDKWRMQQPPLKQAVRVQNVDEIIRQIRDVRKDDEADVTNDPSKYGLENPPVTVTLRGASEAKKDGEAAAVREWKFFVGDTSPDKSFVYVNSSDKPHKVLGVRRSALSSVLFTDPATLRPKSLIDVAALSAKYLDIKREAEELELKKQDDGAWHFLKPGYGLADFEGTKPDSKFAAVPPKQEGGVKGLIEAINGVRVASDSDFVPLSDSTMASYGLEEGKERMRIQVGSSGLKDEMTRETLLVGDKIEGKDKKVQYYVRMAGDEGVAKIDATALEGVVKFLKRPGQLRSRDVLPFDAKDVDVIDLKRGKEVLKLRHPEGEAWKLFIDKEQHKADDKAVQGLLDSLRGKGEVKEYFDESDADAKKKDAERGLDQPAAEVVLYSAGIEKKEEKKKDGKGKKDKKEEKTDEGEPKLKKDAKPAVTLTFGKTEGDLVYVKRVLKDGTVSRLAVPKSILDKVQPKEGALAFFDTALPSFEPSQVTQFELDRDGEKVVVVKGEGDQSGRWLLKDRKDYSGRNFADTPQVTSLLRGLGSLHVQKWVHKLDAKDNLDKYGLTKPALTATVMVRKDDFQPASLASTIAAIGSPVPGRPFLAAVSLLAGKSANKGEPVVFKFGKEAGEKEGVYGVRTGSDYLFQVAPATVKTLREAELRDRSWLTLLQPALDLGFLGSFAGQQAAPLAASPLVTGQVLALDPDKVKEIRLAIRTRVELRNLDFQRTRKDKTWEDKSGLQEFTADQDKVNEVVKWLAGLQTERFVFLTPGVREEQKLDAKEATLKVDLFLTDGRAVTVTVGALMEVGEGQRAAGYYATTSAWPDVVFLVPADRIEPMREGAGYFGKARVAAR